MKIEEHGWKTADGVPISAAVWRPDTAPSAAVALVHGMADHQGRFSNVAKAMVDAGFLFSTFDLRGHGKSGGPRIFAPTYEALLGDVDIHLEQTRKRAPDAPLFLYGHSMGGNIVLGYALKRKPKLAGVIATSPGLGSGTPQPPLKILFGKIMNRIIPTLIIQTGFPPDGLSRDPAVIEAARKDTLFQSGTSVRLAFEILAAGEWIGRQTEVSVPLLVMQGSADTYVDPALTAGFLKRLKGDVTFKLWEGAYHELHTDLVKREAIAYILGWIAGKRGKTD
jgi:alpha-beta hydrolase superfamily lysophospholipase